MHFHICPTEIAALAMFIDAVKVYAVPAWRYTCNVCHSVKCKCVNIF